MKYKIIILTLILLINSARAELGERSSIPSNYIDQLTCSKLENKYSKKYTLNYLSNLFSSPGPNQADRNSFILSQMVNSNGIELLNSEKVNVLNISRCKRLIDDVEYNLLLTQQKIDNSKYDENYLSNNIPVISMSLENYLLKKQNIQSSSHKNYENISTDPFPLSLFPADIGTNQKITEKERLYALYSPTQIKKMAQAVAFTLKVMDAVKVETVVEFSEQAQENYVIDHTPSDIYRLALRIFKMEKRKLQNDNLNKGLPFSNIDFLVAAYEMNIISNSTIEIFTKEETFYKKDKSFLTKLGSYLTNIGVTAAQINPTTAPYAIIGMMLYNSYHSVKNPDAQIDMDAFYFN